MGHRLVEMRKLKLLIGFSHKRLILPLDPRIGDPGDETVAQHLVRLVPTAATFQ